VGSDNSRLPEPETLEIISLCRPIPCPVLCPLPNFGRSVRLMFGTQFLAWKRARVDIGVTGVFAWFVPYRKYWSALEFDFRTLLLAEGRRATSRHFQEARPHPFRRAVKGWGVAYRLLAIFPRKAQWPVKPCCSFVESV
jgi:hypothetical protein